MEKFIDRGYIVRENGPVYFTKDMDRTVRWFEEVLGWYSEIDERDESGIGMYGCVYSLPHAIERSHLAPFTGIHLFYGEPGTEMVAFMKVEGIEQMRQYILDHGWEKVTPIDVRPWGGKSCQVTTIDGCILRFFE